MNNNGLKTELLSRVDEIVEAIKNDKVIEIKRENGNILIFETKRKKLNKIKRL